MYELIQSSSSVAIFTHINPDGDALGSTIGLASYLAGKGKKATIFLPTPISESLQFMAKENAGYAIRIWDAGHEEKLRLEISECDLIVGLDFNVLQRIGDFGPLLADASAKKILVDHHVGPEMDAFDKVISKTDISSASELLYSTIMQFPDIAGDASRLPKESREALMTGMTTDTNNFANSVFPSTLIMASQLIAAGTDRDAIIDNLYFKTPERAVRLRGYAIDKLMKINDKGVGYIILDAETLKSFDIREGDTEGLVNVPLSIDRVKMSILAKEESDSPKIRISIRSKKGTSARECSMKYFHGGGHEQASGGRLVKGEDVQCIEDVEKYIEKMSDGFFVE